MAKQMSYENMSNKFIKLVSTGVVDFHFTLSLTEQEAEMFNVITNKLDKISDCASFLTNEENNLFLTSTPKENKKLNIFDNIRFSSNNPTINSLLFINRAFKKKVFIEYITMNEIFFASENSFMKDVIKYVTEQNFLFLVENRFLPKLDSKITFEIKISNKTIKIFENICDNNHPNFEANNNANINEQLLNKNNNLNSDINSLINNENTENINKQDNQNTDQKTDAQINIKITENIEDAREYIAKDNIDLSLNNKNDCENLSKFNDVKEKQNDKIHPRLSSEINSISDQEEENYHEEKAENIEEEEQKNKMGENVTNDNQEERIDLNNENNEVIINQSKKSLIHDISMREQNLGSVIPPNEIPNNKDNEESQPNIDADITANKIITSIQSVEAKQTKENNIEDRKRSTPNINQNPTNYIYNNFDDNANTFTHGVFERFRYDFTGCNYLFIDLNEIVSLNKTHLPLKEFQELLIKISNDYRKICIISSFPKVLKNLTSIDLDSITLINDIIGLTDIYFLERSEALPLLNILAQLNSDNENIEDKKNLEFLFNRGMKRKKKTFPKIGIFFDGLQRVTIIQQQPKANSELFNMDYQFNIIPVNVSTIIFDNYQKIFSVHNEYLKSVFIGGFLSRFFYKKSFNTAFTAGNESIKRVIELIRFNLDPPLDFNYYLIRIKKQEKASSEEVKHNKNKEEKFVLDSVNLVTSKMKEYNPLHDSNLVSFFSSNFTRTYLQKKGFINRNGVILDDPEQKKIAIIESKNFVKIYEQEKNNLQRIKEEKIKMKRQIKGLLNANINSIRTGSLKDLNSLEKIYKFDPITNKKLPIIEGKKTSMKKTNFNNNTYLKFISTGQKPKSLFNFNPSKSVLLKKIGKNDKSNEKNSQNYKDINNRKLSNSPNHSRVKTITQIQEKSKFIDEKIESSRHNNLEKSYLTSKSKKSNKENVLDPCQEKHNTCIDSTEIREEPLAEKLKEEDNFIKFKLDDNLNNTNRIDENDHAQIMDKDRIITEHEEEIEKKERSLSHSKTKHHQEIKGNEIANSNDHINNDVSHISNKRQKSNMENLHENGKQNQENNLDRSNINDQIMDEENQLEKNENDISKDHKILSAKSNANLLDKVQEQNQNTHNLNSNAIDHHSNELNISKRSNLESVSKNGDVYHPEIHEKSNVNEENIKTPQESS